MPVTTGTVFQSTETPLTVWFEAARLMTVPKNGVSATTLSRVPPISSYQTAWAVVAKLRAAMSEVDKDRLSAVVEVDECIHGGAAKGGTTLTGQDLVAAAVEHRRSGRGYGRVRLGLIVNRSAWELRLFVRAHVEPGSRVIANGLSACQSAPRGLAGHEARNESAPGPADAHELLTGVHWVFSVGERWLSGTHQGSVQPGHL
ncbi:MAG: IS1595 family transposase [Propionibacteriaceae bacterium]|nr:IS1595 family transposase [Propionibacteriaceae bacterium]